jgi:hypothetical protein
VVIAFALPLVVYATLGFYSRFIADDYCAAVKVNDLGIVNAVVNDYTQWYGRVSASSANNLAGQAGPHAMPYTPVLVLAVWFVGLLWLGYEALAFVQARRYSAILLACVVLSSTLAGSPQLYQSFYWLSGVYTYAASVALFSYIPALILFGLRRNAAGVRRLVIIGAIFVLSFLAGAFSEPYAAAQGLAFASALIAIISVRRSPKHPAFLLVGAALAGANVAIIILLAAPGNAVRQSSFQQASSLFTAGIDALIHAAAFIVASVTSFSPGGALAALFFPALLAYSGLTAEALERITRRQLRIWITLSFAVGFALIAAFMFPAMYATSVPPPARGYIIPQFFLICSFATAGFLIGIYARKTMPHPSLTAQRLVVVFAVIALIAGPVLTAVRAVALFAPLSTFAAEFDQRDAGIRAVAASGETSIAIPAYTIDVAERVGLETIGDDPTFWVNACAARYYGVNSLVIE